VVLDPPAVALMEMFLGALERLSDFRSALQIENGSGLKGSV
jgi:hypothetical protein